ncbi:MAG: bifunctional (p)ppGpp synthetase/guanosine-3',5'-bis(diphosphate) 3'-pyrophosphohydrolase [Candidatus Zixiibacteriota bacterium]|nr:MAG: bifunctional (p)ppGpp synthetase/guanosine-3',5'-bis(diphosphate) 3'-pyrophosphohydrolase [candidate division Zixibacteria bacterium]
MNLAEFIIKIESFNANVDIPLLRRAYEFSDKAHAGQLRESGDPYIEHCLNVAFILAELHLDSVTIAAALVHDVVEDTDVKLEDITKEFGEEIATLVDGVTKISMVEFKSREDQQVEYFRKMLLSMARDIRVILIKLADRLNNMRTLQYLDEDKQKRIAEETRDVYAPLAHRFGISKIKTQLEDLSLKFLDPETYDEIAKKIELTREEREQYISTIVEPIRNALTDAGVKADVYGRAKHIDSICRKIKIRDVPFEKISDLLAIRILLRTKTECYHAIGVVHELWPSVRTKFADYIASPKPNNYQSLHTAIIGPGKKVVEIQIRTHEMHRIAENGIAAHWLYKEGRQQLDKTDRQMLWLRDVLDWQKDMTNPSEFMEYIKIDLFADDIYVYTPAGEIKHLPAGATPLDFAFFVHTEVGLHCSGANVNGRIAPLNSKLQSGDEVEILTSPHRHPSQDWLNVATTSQARAKIRRWLKQTGYQQAVALGKELLDQELKKIRLKFPSDDDLLEIAQSLSFNSTDDLLYAVGSGSVSAQRVIARIIPEEEEPDKEPMVEQVLEKYRIERGIRIEGIDNMMFRFAGCCQPIPGEDIVGYITRGRGVTVHRVDCPMAHELIEHPERTVPVSWNVSKDQTFVVRLEVQVEPRKNILVDITDSIADSDTNVKGADIDISDTCSVGTFVVEVKNLHQLEQVLRKIEKVKGVISVRRARGANSRSNQAQE